jgi:septum formation protein
MDREPIVLASVSPRRAEILRSLGLPPQIHPAHVDETVLPDESPEDHAERLARAKAAAVAGLLPDRWVLGGDTVVAVDEAILGKPRDEEHAVEMLLRLQGRSHRVVSGLALVRPGREAAEPAGEGPGSGSRIPPPDRIFSGVQATEVRFRAFDRAFAEAYAATGEPLDKAGAYGIQGRGAALVERLDGSWTNVVGLPLVEALTMLRAAGMPAWPDRV